MTGTGAAPGPDPKHTSDPDVCFVSMPYGALNTPSLALGLLTSILDREGITATVASANLWFAEQVGLRPYGLCATRLPIVFLAGEWTFAGSAFADDPRRAARDEDYLRQLTIAVSDTELPGGRMDGPTVIAQLRTLREQATEFVDVAARRVLATGARVVGCTSTFEQHVPSLALLRRVRELDPSVVTMLGGANCETTMGEVTHKSFPWVDFVVSGEADAVIAPLVRMALDRDITTLTRDELPNGVFGPCHRSDGVRTALPLVGGGGRVARATFNALDTLPTPDYRDYFAALAASPLHRHVRPGLPMESSRGCWWGAVHQCTFCGLNGTGLAYRSKSPDRVLAEMNELADRHGIADFEMVDNILDMKYFGSLLPALAEDGRSRRIFYEIKANLTREQVIALRAANVTWVQPGIESLHSGVLEIMDKGVRGWQNIQLLKWSREYGLRLSWSVLWGFPGEKDEWYAEMADWFPALEHLPPPTGAPKIRYDRYSVYHEQARERGLLLFPLGTMAQVYPLWPADLERLTYFFSDEPSAGPQRLAQSAAAAIASAPGVHAVIRAAKQWQQAARDRRPVLARSDDGAQLHILDTRACTAERQHVLHGLDRAVCLASDRAPRPGRMASIVRDEFGLSVTDDEVADAIDRLVSARLILPIDDRLLGLSLAAAPPMMPPPTAFPGGHVSADRELVPAENRG